jgi:hypothetical protein
MVSVTNAVGVNTFLLWDMIPRFFVHRSQDSRGIAYLLLQGALLCSFLSIIGTHLQLYVCRPYAYFKKTGQEKFLFGIRALAFRFAWMLYMSRKAKANNREVMQSVKLTSYLRVFCLKVEEKLKT